MAGYNHLDGFSGRAIRFSDKQQRYRRKPCGWPLEVDATTHEASATNHDNDTGRSARRQWAKYRKE